MVSLLLMFLCLGPTCLHGIANPISKQEPGFECVDIYKQPAFQHPSMKNHRIMQSRDIVLKGRGCPKGQVPVHKLKTNVTNNFLNPRHFITKAGRRILKEAKGVIKNNLHYAIITPVNDPAVHKWNGAEATFGVKSPKVAKGQFSKSWIWLSNGLGNIFNSIQFGWAVHPELYGDNRPRLTTYWTRTKQDGCYNLNCGGFVQTHHSIHLGMAFDEVHREVPGRTPGFLRLFVEQDPGMRIWILMVEERRVIGYWPMGFLPELDNGATELHYGGYVGGLVGLNSPQMGSGEFPTADLKQSCAMKSLRFALNFKFTDIDSKKVMAWSSKPNCYGVKYLKFLGGENRETLTFGGPGGECG